MSCHTTGIVQDQYSPSRRKKDRWLIAFQDLHLLQRRHHISCNKHDLPCYIIIVHYLKGFLYRNSIFLYRNSIFLYTTNSQRRREKRISFLSFRSQKFHRSGEICERVKNDSEKMIVTNGIIFFQSANAENFKFPVRVNIIG